MGWLSDLLNRVPSTARHDAELEKLTAEITLLRSQLVEQAHLREADQHIIAELQKQVNTLTASRDRQKDFAAEQNAMIAATTEKIKLQHESNQKTRVA